MNLRDLVTPETTIEGLDTLLAKKFDFDDEDVPLVRAISYNHRQKRRKQEGPTFNVTSDYSPETKIFLSYLYHQLKTFGLPKKALQAYKESLNILIDFYLRINQNPAYEKDPRYDSKHLGEETLKEFERLVDKKVLEVNFQISDAALQFSLAEAEFLTNIKKGKKYKNEILFKNEEEDPWENQEHLVAVLNYRSGHQTAHVYLNGHLMVINGCLVSK